MTGPRVGLILPMGDETQPGVPQRWPGIRDLAVAAEAGGLDAVWVYDHLLSDGPEQAAESPWEAWTLLTALTGATTRVRLGVLVLCTPFRDAGVLARMADTFQEVSGDRLVLGLGCGWHQPEFDAYGFPFEERVGRFAEQLTIATVMLRTGRSTFDGRYYRTTDAPVRERPDRVAPEVLVAAKRPRMLRLAAERADAWNIAWFGRPGPVYAELAGALDTACADVGRDPATLRRTVGVRVSASSTEEPTRVIAGDAAAVADGLAAWAEQGVDELIVWPEPNTPETLGLVTDAVAIMRAS